MHKDVLRIGNFNSILYSLQETSVTTGGNIHICPKNVMAASTNQPTKQTNKKSTYNQTSEGDLSTPTQYKGFSIF